ncbi:MAG: ammonium transporter [Leptospiraceae bacterium]|nr:ammonium transporter [Leptospiraceae bacterium]MCP5485902.1 ammonium transporter [Spirochaetales bacterium]
MSLAEIQSTLWSSRVRFVCLVIVLGFLMGAGSLSAQEAGGAAGVPAFVPSDAGQQIDAGRTAWMLVSTALVLLMVPGLALFYGGMVRHKNMINTIMLSLICMAVIGVEWVLIGYNMAFGESIGGLFAWSEGGLGLSNIEWYQVNGSGVPELVFVMFQGKFAIITPALITGAIVERVRFSAFIVFALLWAVFVYNPLAHMVWGAGGWLFDAGVLDFAGGTVVHISAGISALVLVLVYLRKRIGYPEDAIRPGSPFQTMLGAGLLWVGWFGFNAGSAIATADDFMLRAGLAFTTTQIAASAAALTWILIEWIAHGKPTGIGLASGMVAGLVAITPAAGHVTPMSALVLGIASGALCYAAVMAKGRLGYDDTLDVFGVHGIGGIVGALGTGLLVTIGSQHLGWFVGGDIQQFKLQALGVGFGIVFAGLGTLILGALVHFTIGFRVTSKEETLGLDLTQHGEAGINLR